MPGVGLTDGRPVIALDNSLGDGVAGATSHVMDVELAHEMLPMFVHGFEAHAQFDGDLFVGPAFPSMLNRRHQNAIDEAPDGQTTPGQTA